MSIEKLIQEAFRLYGGVECPNCHQTIPFSEDGRLMSHPTAPMLRDVCPRSGGLVSRAEMSFGEVVLSEEQSKALKGHSMEILYADQPLNTDGPGIFLAGPTPRRSDVPSWRPKAIEILKELQFAGKVFVPERKDWSVQFDYVDQILWERKALDNCSIIAFWIPRQMETMPALTTNIEFGYYIACSPERVLYGRPSSAVHCGYLDWLYDHRKEDEIIYDSLESLLKEAVIRCAL